MKKKKKVREMKKKKQSETEKRILKTTIKRGRKPEKAVAEVEVKTVGYLFFFLVFSLSKKIEV